MMSWLIRKTSVIGAIAVSLVAGLAASDGRGVQVLGEAEQAETRGGSLGYSCTGSLNCSLCTAPTCQSNGAGGCVVKKAGSGGCSDGSTINVCKSDSIYYRCSNDASGL